MEHTGVHANESWAEGKKGRFGGIGISVLRRGEMEDDDDVDDDGDDDALGAE